MRVGPIGPSPPGSKRLARSGSEAIALRSAPAQKVPPAPVKTATSWESSASKSEKARTSASAVGPSTALRASGRSIVTTATAPLTSTRTSDMPATLDADVYGSRRQPSFEDGFQEFGYVPWSDDVFESCDLIEADPAPRMKVCARRS